MNNMEIKPTNWLGTKKEDETKELEWSGGSKIPDGKHAGVITNVTYREEPYEYTDIWVMVDSISLEMKYGVPTNLSPQTKLGKLMIDFGQQFELGKTIKPKEILMGKKVEFMTIMKGDYSEIVEDSLKPLITNSH